MLRALVSTSQRLVAPTLPRLANPSIPSFFAPLPAFNTRIMSSKDDKPTGMATEGLPKGPEIKEHTQVKSGQPGSQAEMGTKPEITRLPTQHGHSDVLALEEYVGVGKLKGRRVIVTGGDSGIGLSAAVIDHVIASTSDDDRCW